MLTPQQKQRLQDAAAAADLCEHLSGCPAELTVSQWALESGWGVNQPGNNCFGIKEYPGCWGTQKLKTWEVINGARQSVLDSFATFESLLDCFLKHADLLTTGRPYVDAFGDFLKTKDVARFTQMIALKYATDPAYGNKLESIQHMAEVKEALGK